jgi:hypothetical protein
MTHVRPASTCLKSHPGCHNLPSEIEAAIAGLAHKQRRFGR